MDALLVRIGWSKRHFAVVAGVDERTVYDWVADRVSGPSYRLGVLYLETIARLMGV